MHVSVFVDKCVCVGVHTDAHVYRGMPVGMQISLCVMHLFVLAYMWILMSVSMHVYWCVVCLCAMHVRV